MSGSVAKLLLRSVLTSVVQVTTEVGDLGWSLQLGWSLGAPQHQGPYRQGWPVLPLGALALSGPRLLPRAMSGSGFTFVVPVASKGHEATLNQISHLSPGWCSRARMHAQLSGLLCYSMSW